MLGDEMITWLVSAVALVAVCVPFVRGLRIALGGWSATRRVSSEELKRGQMDRPGTSEPLGLA